MIDYAIILFAVVCFAGQFAFTKLYEGEVGQTAAAFCSFLPQETSPPRCSSPSFQAA